MVIYNAGVSCSEGIDEPPLKQLKRIWEQSVLTGLGRDRNVNAKRLLFLYDSGVCVYPAQSLEYYKGGVKTRENEGNYYTEIRYNGAKYIIERNADDPFSNTEDKQQKFTTFWAPLRAPVNQGSWFGGNTIGAIGLQIN